MYYTALVYIDMSEIYKIFLPVSNHPSLYADGHTDDAVKYTQMLSTFVLKVFCVPLGFVSITSTQIVRLLADHFLFFVVVSL